MILRFIVGMMMMANITAVFGQESEELDRRNGFKDIKMGSLITVYEGLEYNKDIQDEEFPEAKLYKAKKGYYESIGNIKIHDLEVKTYRDSIFEVRVITEKEPNLYKGLKKAFGEPAYNYLSGFYYWTSERLRLSYSSHSNKKIAMTYRSYVMSAKLKKEKKQVVEEITSDF